MKKLLFLFLVTILGFGPAVKADEGMWLPMFVERLNYVDMEKMGLHLTAEEIYSINHSSLKDAIIIFGNGCTGEIISDQGLILTNHHCGYGQIQAHSSVEHDYLTDGFWAMKKSEELPNPGLSAQFLVRVEDVSSRVLASLNEEMTETERNEQARKTGQEITSEALKDTHYNGYVRSFFGGNEYYLFIYETYRDIRLVGAPPSSIGKFGADTDNWMWPRHTADFSMFRVYTGTDGKPADYSTDNKPMSPKHFLPVSLDGVKNDDFAMIMGYPGGTDRYLTSYGVDLAIEESNPTIVKIRDKKLKIMREDMDANPAVRIQYASKYARIANYWKYFIGQTKGLKRLKVSDKKKALEADFTTWVKGNKMNSLKYGKALPLVKEAYAEMKKTNLANIYFREAIYRGSEIFAYSSKYGKLAKTLSNKEASEEEINELVEKLKADVDGYFKDYNRPTDQKLLARTTQMYFEDVPAEFHPEMLQQINKKYKGDFSRWAADVFAKSVFTSKEDVLALLDRPKAKTITKDPAFQLFEPFVNVARKMSETTRPAYEKLNRGNRLFIAGLREMQPNKKFYPDANFTMRLTYGTVKDYYPADAVHYDYFTTLAGVMEKEDPNNWEFVVHPKLKELYQAKDYGRYGENGVMKTCFLTTHDITGGNSGSPVINGDGQLIGLAFDGNWEAMSGDIAFEPELQRTICADIRYVMFIIDKFAGAQNLIDEIQFVKTPTRIAPAVEQQEAVEAEAAEVER